MTKRHRKKHSADFKAKVALAAVKGEKTIAQLAQEYELAPSLVNKWKAQLLDNLALAFGEGAQAKDDSKEAEIEKLHAKIGELLIERDFLKKVLKN